MLWCEHCEGSIIRDGLDGRLKCSLCGRGRTLTANDAKKTVLVELRQLLPAPMTDVEFNSTYVSVGEVADLLDVFASALRRSLKTYEIPTHNFRRKGLRGRRAYLLIDDAKAVIKRYCPEGDRRHEIAFHTPVCFFSGVCRPLCSSRRGRLLRSLALSSLRRLHWVVWVGTLR